MAQTVTARAEQRIPAPVVLLLALLGLTVLGLTIGVLPGVRPGPGAVPLFDDWIQLTGYGLAAAVAVWRVVARARHRLLWSCVAAALVLRCYGFLHTIVVLDRAPVYPSPADVAWILSGLLLVVALLAAARDLGLFQGAGLLGLDAVCGGLLVGGLVSTFLDGTMDRLAPGGIASDVLVTNLTYPLIDVAVLAVMAGLVTAAGARLPLDVGVLCAGLLVFSVVDVWFLYLLASGEFAPGSVLAPLSLGGTAVIATAGWLRPPEDHRPRRATSPVLTVVFALSCVLLLAYDAFGPVNNIAILLASAGVVVAIARATLTFSGDRRRTEATIASKDEALVRFRALVEASSDFIGMGTLGGEILYVNPAGRAMMRLPDDADLSTMSILDSLTDAERRHAVEVERPAIMQRGSWNGPSTVRDHAGGPGTPVMKNTFLVRRPDTGEPWVMATIMRDVSDLREAESNLLRFRALVEASSDFIALAGVDGTVQFLNPAGRRLVGLADDVDVASMTIADFLTEEGLRASLEIEQPAVVEHGEWYGESTLRDLRGGPAIPVTINSFLIRHPATGEPWLLATVQRDMSDLHAAREQLQHLADDRQDLLGHLVEAQEAERARIAADVHDDPVQAMAAVDLRLGLVQRQLELGRDREETLRTVAELRQTVGEANERLRHLLFDLDSPAQREDLPTALGEAAAFILGDAVRWEVRCTEQLALPETSRVLAYRIAKEALVNVRKHAKATSVTITIRREDGGISVAVADDGRGLPASLSPRPGHRGVHDMRDRAAVAGGKLWLETGSAGGTEVRLWLPASGHAH